MPHNELGQEIPDPTPLEIPAGMRRPETVNEMMARMIRTEVSRAAESAGAESFEDSFDFDVDDPEELPLTGHEFVAMHVEMGEQGEHEGDTGDGEDGGANQAGSGRVSQSGGRGKPRKDEQREDDREPEGRDNHRTTGDTRRRQRGNPRDTDGADARERGTGREELDE